MPEWTYLGKDREGMWTRQLSLPIEGDLSNQEQSKVSPMSSGNDPFDVTPLSWISAWCSAKSSSLEVSLVYQLMRMPRLDFCSSVVQ